MAFIFPNPALEQTVTNPETGITYTWLEDPGKWIIEVTGEISNDALELIWEGDTPPDPIGTYKLWYSTDTLELYFYYCDVNNVCAWVPTSAPITALEELTVFKAEAEVDISQLQYTQQSLQNALDQIYLEVQGLLNQDVYVKKEGGDSMEGPLVIKSQDPTQGRETNKVQTLGVFSNSEGSALRLGTTRDRVYVGHDDTSINGPVKIQEVKEKTTGQGIKVSNDLKMSTHQIKELDVATEDTDAVPYGQVKGELKDLKDQIIEQAAVGVFKWDTQSSNTAPVSGCFFGKNDANNATEPFINNFRVSNQDINGSNQDFSTWEVGDIITWTSSTNSAYQIRYRVETVPTFQNGHYYFEVQYISQNSVFVQADNFILTRQQFTNIDFGDLETTYLRLDASNGPVTTSVGLEVKTNSESGGGFGEAALTLNGKRDNADNSCGAIRFKNWNYGNTDEINGYITYYTNQTKHFFRFSKDIDLPSGVNLSFGNGSAIQHNGGDRIIFDAASNGNEGSGLVVFTRPGNTARRGVVIKGKYKNDDGNTVSDGDLFFSYTNSDIDAINYVGKISGKHNIVNKDYVDNANTGILEGKLKNKGAAGTPTSGQFVPMWGASYNSGNVQDMNTIKLHSLDGYDFRTTGSAACPGTLTIASRGDVLWHGIIEKKSVSGDTCTIYMVKLYAKSATWDTSSDYYFHISGFKRDMS